MELTPEQLQAAESMSLEELKAAALKEDAGEPVEVKTAESVVTAAAQPRDENGRFMQADTLDNKDDVVDAPEENGEPTTTIYRKEIANGDGSVDVYEAESLEDLVEKLAVGKLNANKKIQEFIAENKARGVQNEQVNKDDEYLVQQRLKDNPKATIKQVVAEVIEERATREREWTDVQNRFVATHPDFYPCPANGNRIASEAQRLGLPNTSAGLEKAYQSLKTSGLLVAKAEGAGDATEVKTVTTQQTAENAADTTQQRSVRKGSSISTRSGSRTTVVTNAQPTEDDLYKMPMEKLKELANKQLADANSGE